MPLYHIGFQPLVSLLRQIYEMNYDKFTKNRPNYDKITNSITTNLRRRTITTNLRRRHLEKAKKRHYAALKPIKNGILKDQLRQIYAEYYDKFTQTA